MFTLTFRTDNAAFDENAAYETAETLAGVARQLREGATSGVVRDYNGNKIGAWSLVDHRRALED